MVAHRSPKPPVRVRVLLPLPKNFAGITCKVFLFILIIIKYYVIIISKTQDKTKLLVNYQKGFKMEQLQKLIKKFLTREVILYIVFGVLTTIVNIGISYLLEGVFHINGAIASAIGIICAVLFAYFTNRKMVFNSTANSFKEKFQEFGKFMLGRAFTMVVEEGGVILFYNILHLPFQPVKLAFTVIVIILNFFISKFFAFKKNS